MPTNTPYGLKAPIHTRKEAALGTRLDSGPYIGKVKSNVDPSRLGRLRVYIPELGGLDEDDPNNWRTVSYASPYIGTTQPSVAEGTNNTVNAYGATRESYGFWMTPPDVGINVLCIFVNGSADQGYYIGCIPGMTSHHMVPGLAGSAKPNVETMDSATSVKAGTNAFLPVTEFNKNETANVLNPDIYKNISRPVHALQLEHFSRQGLVGDRIRGVISSSSMRESPSAVFGFSTPGRVVASNPENTQEVWMREGGHSLVMDDGDEVGKDQLIRLRTSNGHQIMMNDSAGVIYIINSNGNAWFEMGANGSIRMYSEADISFNCSGDFNLNAGGSVNIAAGDTVNIKASSTFSAQASADMNLQGSNIVAFASGTLGLAGASIDVAGQAAVKISGSELGLVGTPIKLNSGPVATVKEPAAVSSPIIVPQAEPWPRPGGTEEGLEAAALAPIADMPGKPRSEDSSRPTNSGTDATKNVKNHPAMKINDILATMPDPPGGIGILTKYEVKVLFANIAKSESGGPYNTENSIGYSGRYQFGVAALEDFGYVKKGSWAKYGKNIALRNPEIWTGKDGLSSQADWFNAGALQEKVMYQNALRNYNAMVKNGAVREGDPPEVVAGMIKVAHLLGAGGWSSKYGKYVGAKGWREGQGGSDAYGTSGDKYFAQGKQAILAMADVDGKPKSS